MCGILAMQGDLQPSSAFECRNAERFTIQHYFEGNYQKYREYMVYELKRDFGEKYE